MRTVTSFPQGNRNLPGCSINLEQTFRHIIALTFLLSTKEALEGFAYKRGRDKQYLSKVQQVKKFLFNVPEFRNLGAGVTLLQEQSSEKRSKKNLRYMKLPLKQSLLKESDLKLVDVIIPEGTAIGKDNLAKALSADAKQALSTESNPKPADVINQESTTEEIQSLKKELLAEEQEVSLSQIQVFVVPGAFLLDDAFLHTNEFTKNILNEPHSEIPPKPLSSMRGFFQETYRQIVKSFRPAVEEGFRRIEWHCVSPRSFSSPCAS
jgi:hypothetical protein